MVDNIYLVQDDGRLIEMGEHAYDSEDVLQRLLADYPHLLAGDQIDASAPRRWVLISREVGVPSEEDGAQRWAVDHVFLDQDGIPTLVEVKRSTDTRVRREVVGQMLDYAANAVVYWPIEGLRATFEQQCDSLGHDPVQELESLIGPGADTEQFWQQVKTNLQAGKVRLIFVADVIPPELRRIVEFLNVQMDPAEVLALEVRQYVGQGLKTLVPRVVGQTAEAQHRKASGSRPSKQWDETSFLQELEARRGVEEARVARAILAWAQGKNLRIWWGKGSQDGSFFPLLDIRGTSYWLISVWTYGRLEMQFQMMKNKPPFDEEAKRLELLRRLNALPGVDIPADAITRRPSIPLTTLQDEVILKQFLDICDWIIGEVTAS